MKVVGFCGYSGSGKTTLVEQLIQRLKLAGQRVSVAKHAHHAFDLALEGKDSWRPRPAAPRLWGDASARPTAEAPHTRPAGPGEGEGGTDG